MAMVSCLLYAIWYWGDCCAQSALSPCVCFGQHKGQLRCGGALAIHISGCLPDAHRAALFHQLTMERKDIPWGDLFAEAGIFDAAEEGQFAFVFGNAQRATAPSGPVLPGSAPPA